MNTQKKFAVKFRKVLAFVLCLGLILFSSAVVFNMNVYAEKTFTISPSYSSADTLASKLITITASEAAFSPGSAYPRIYIGNALQDVTITSLESTLTQVKFKIASTLQNGQTYTIGIDGPTNYKYLSVASLVVNAPSISGTAPLSTILKGYDSQKSVTISGLYTNFSLGQTSVELLQSSTVKATGTVTSVQSSGSTGQQLVFSIPTGLNEGNYDLRITTGSEIITKNGAIRVLGSQSIVLNQTSLNSSYSNGTTITITGTNTLFSSDTTSVSIIDSNGDDTEKAGTKVINSATSLTFPVSSGLEPGTYTVQVQTTGTSETAPKATLVVLQPTGVLKKNDVAITTLGGNYPNLALTIVGSNTSFQSGSTQLFVFTQGGQASLTGKISGTPSINGQTITFTLAGGDAALTPGSYVFKAVTGSQTAEIPFTVVAPKISDIKYNSIVVDTSGTNAVIALGYKTFSVEVTGSNTHFSSNTTLKIENNSVPVIYSSETKISFNMPEGKNTGTYTMSFDMDGNNATSGDVLTKNFVVDDEASITSVSPSSIVNLVDSVTVTVIGSNTHFTAGNPTVDIDGANEQIDNISVIDDTTLTFRFSPKNVTENNYVIKTSISNGVIAENAKSSSEILTVTNSGFINNTPVLYTLDMYSTVVNLKGENLTESINEATSVKVGGVAVANKVIDPDTSTISFNMPSNIVNPGTYEINIGSNYISSVVVVKSYISSFSPTYEVYGYTNKSFTINGNTTVTFDEANLPSVQFLQDTTTKETISSGITKSGNSLTFDIPEGLETGLYSIKLDWGNDKYIDVTGNFEIKREINALALSNNNNDAGQSITTYLNGQSFELKAIGTKAQESGTVDKTLKAEWESSNENVVTVSSGAITIVGAGTATVTASWDGCSDSVDIVVNGPANIEISLLAGNNSLNISSQSQLKATAIYADTTDQDVTSKVKWSSSDTEKSEVSQTGLVTAVGSGSAVITATFASNSLSKSDTESFSISNLTLSPSSVNTASLHADTQITVSGIDTSKGVGGIAVSVDSISKTSTIAAVQDSTDSFTFKPGVLSAKSYTISITKGEKTYTKTLTVAQSSITPSLSMLSPNYNAFDLVINGNNITFDNGERKPAVSVGGTPINDSSVIVNESLNTVTFPFAAGKALGIYKVVFTWESGVYSGCSLETTINVTDEQVNAVKIYMDGVEVTGNVEMDVNGTANLTLKAFGASNNDLGYVTSLAQWNSSSTSVATVEEGSVTAISAGSTQITASYQSKSDSVSVIVSDGTTPAGGTGGGIGGGGGGGFVGPETTPIATPTPTPVPDTEKNIITVDNARINDEILKLTDGQKKVISFDINNGDKNVKELQLSEEAVNVIVDKNVAVELKSGSVELVIPAEIFKSLSNSTVKIDVSQIGADEKTVMLKELPKSAAKKLNVLSDIVDLKIFSTSNSTDKYISTFNSKIKLELALGNNDLSSVNTKKLGIYYFDETKKSWEYVGGKYNAETKKVEAETSHFTKFTVIEYLRTFADVKSNSWAKEYIELLAARHITDGVDENNFDPGGVVTRAQFATFLVKALGIETKGYTGKFKDVSENKWYTLYIEAAERVGLVNGYGKGVFNPNANITREQMAAMVMNAYKYKTQADISKEAAKTTSKFRDETKISSWAKESVYAAQTKGIIKGMEGNLYNPNDNAKREQAARVIIGLIELID